MKRRSWFLRWRKPLIEFSSVEPFSAKALRDYKRQLCKAINASNPLWEALSARR